MKQFLFGLAIAILFLTGTFFLFIRPKIREDEMRFKHIMEKYDVQSVEIRSSKFNPIYVGRNSRGEIVAWDNKGNVYFK